MAPRKVARSRHCLSPFLSLSRSLALSLSLSLSFSLSLPLPLPPFLSLSLSRSLASSLSRFLSLWLAHSLFLAPRMVVCSSSPPPPKSSSDIREINISFKSVNKTYYINRSHSYYQSICIVILCSRFGKKNKGPRINLVRWSAAAPTRSSDKSPSLSPPFSLSLSLPPSLPPSLPSFLPHPLPLAPRKVVSGLLSELLRQPPLFPFLSLSRSRSLPPSRSHLVR